MNHRLSSERLPDQQQDEAEVRESRGADKSNPMDFLEVREPRAPPDIPTEERQQLHRMHPHEVSNAQITAGRAPADHGQSRAAISDSHTVRADNARPGASSQARSLFRSRPNHEECRRHANA